MESTTMDDDPFQKVHQELLTICTNGYKRMRGLWEDMFDDEICLDYSRRLPEHLTSFFEEVYAESYQRRERFVSEIAQLKMEAVDLRRLLGEPPESSPTELEAMPLMLQCNVLDDNLLHMRCMLNKRLEIIEQYMLEMETLCEELSEEPQVLSKDPLPTDRELIEFRSYLDQLIAEKMNRQEEIAKLRHETKKLMGHLETIPMTDEHTRLLNERKFPPTRENLQRLRMLHEDTAAQFESLRHHIDDVRRKLERLWQCLETDPAVVKKFQKLTAYTQTTFDKLFAEHDRCETLRRENMKSFVERIRHEIIEWWDKCLKSEEERSRFSTFNSDVFNEDLLKLHELELDSLKEFYHENEAIFQMVKQRQEMWDRMLALENKSNDPSRYNNRGGKLLEEEKERRRISCQLPKTEAKLVEACKQYEEEHGRKFTIYGTGVEELIEQQWRQRQECKYQISSARKKANGILGVSSAMRTPSRNGAESMLQSSSIMGSNRSRMVTGGSALKRMTPRTAGASATKSGTFLKRKHATPTHGSFNAKRSLLHLLNSPAAGASSVNRTGTMLALPKTTPGKIPSIKVYDTKAGGSVAQKRRSRRKSQGKRRSVSAAKIPSVIVSSAEGTVLQESVCYEKIENFFENNVPNRSSVVAEKLLQQQGFSHRTTRIHQHLLEPENPKEGNFIGEEENVEPFSMPTQAGAPMNVPVASSTMLRSPGIGTSHSTSIASTTRGGSRRLKPAAKNCPIIF